MTLAPSLCCAVRRVAALALLALGTSCSREAPTATRVVPAPSPPAPSSPRGVVDLFQWSMDNRNLPHFEELFTSDFQFAFALTDSAGNGYRSTPFTRNDILIAAHNLFVGGSATEPPASSISLIFDGNPQVSDDLRPGMNPKWHQDVEVNFTLTINMTDGSATRITGGVLCFVARGDSAAIPQDLLARGIKADSTRWFIGRIEDQTNWGAGQVRSARDAAPAPASPAATLPSHKMTLGLLLVLYRQ